eukprot:gene32974-39879_t
MDRIMIIILSVVGLLLSKSLATQYDIWNAPSLTSSDDIQLFFLEAPFPYNVPDDISEAAGDIYNDNAKNHAGLGIWDTTTDDKFTIEFVSSNYVGQLLPDIVNGVINWKNVGKVVITWPTDDSKWKSASLLTTTIGSSYSQLITYMQDNEHKFAAYQPVNALYVNESILNSSSTLYTDANVVLSATSSYWFVNLLVTQLGKYGCDLEVFLPIYTSSFSYLVDTKSAPTVVDTTNADVVSWYTALDVCYQGVYNDTVDNGQGAIYFLDAIGSCYGAYAYIYRTNTTVYNVSLYVSSASASTPVISQSVYTLPPDDDGSAQKLSALDYVMIVLAALTIIGGIAYLANLIFGKKKRRHVSFEGERIAARIAGGEEGAQVAEDDRAYYNAKRKTFMQRISSHFSPQKAAAGMKRNVVFDVRCWWSMLIRVLADNIASRESILGLRDSSLERPLTDNVNSDHI